MQEKKKLALIWLDRMIPEILEKFVYLRRHGFLGEKWDGIKEYFYYENYL